MKIIQMNIRKKEKGIALIMALIMLLVITILGVSSVKMSTLDTQISGNTIYSALTFQGAESALGKVVSDTDLSNIGTSAAAKTQDTVVPNSYFNPAEEVSAGVTLDSTAIISFDGVLDGPVLNNIANSSEFKYQVFRITAESSLKSTSARDTHIEGRAIQIPKS